MTRAEEFIQDYTRGCSNELCAVEDRFGKKVVSYHEWLTPDDARSAVQIAREELLDEVCEWLMLNADDYIVDGVEEHSSAMRHDFIDNFRKAMNDE